MSARREIVPIFVPHAGCPHRCSFCDQNAISRTAALPTPEQVRQLLSAIKQPAQNAQIAFYGGSFTAIDPGYRRALLEAAVEFVGAGKFSGIRVSTRPDAVDDEICARLAAYSVQTVELGAQSMNDGVLSANRRGHTAADTRRAAACVRRAGMELGLQMMTGLYRSDPETDLKTAEALLALCPDFMRVYPTAVFEHTELARLWRAGEYEPQTVAQAVAVCSQILQKARSAGIPIIRMGLHSDLAPDALPLAGAFHPAFGELVLSRLLLWRIEAAVQSAGVAPGARLTVFVARGNGSAATGQKRENLVQLQNKGYTVRVREISGVAEDFISVKENGECS